MRHDARGDRAHRGIGEVRQQRVQPAGPGTQSESRNATSGVSAAARPVFLAAAGPPLTGRRTTLAPAAAAAL